MAPFILVDRQRPWQTIDQDGFKIHFQGRRDSVTGAVAAFVADGIEALLSNLRNSAGHFACMFEKNGTVVAFTDHCRSIPIFYTGGYVGNDARKTKEMAGCHTIDPDSALEASMSGYCTGPHTLFQGLHQLRTSEVACWSHDRPEPALYRYFRYLPEKAGYEQKDALQADVLIAELGHIIDAEMERVIAAANGRAIWVPLSGGYDSRLVLAKLAEANYGNLHAFTYGSPGNDEARIARRVATRLGVPWRFLPGTHKKFRRYYHSQARRDYWRFADGLCSLPRPAEAEPLGRLLEIGAMNPGDVVVNGASGDFFAGSHIRAPLTHAGATPDILMEEAFKKHFGLWGSLQTPDHCEKIRTRYFDVIGVQKANSVPWQDLSPLFELHDYDERQAKYVLNAQRAYEFHGLDWQMPLFGADFAKFWRDVPQRHKIGQILFRHYLRQYDFQNVFSDFDARVRPWPGFRHLALLLPSKVIQLLFGHPARDIFLGSRLIQIQ